MNLKIKQITKTSNGIYIHQTKYVKELLKKFNMNNAKEMKTPMHPITCHGLDEESAEMDRTQYRSMIGSLLYLTTFRPDIMFNVCLCVRFQQEKKVSLSNCY